MGQEVRFSGVYAKGAWTSQGVLSGDGSRIENTEALREWIAWEINSGAGAILDLGCGDLTWISKVEGVRSGRASYYGVDVVASLIEHNRRVFPWFRGEAADIEGWPRINSDIVLLKDVLQHHCNGTAGQILKLVDGGRWRRLVVTSNPRADNASRRGLRGGLWRDLDVEITGLIKGRIIERIHRPGGGEYQVWSR